MVKVATNWRTATLDRRERAISQLSAEREARLAVAA